MTHMTRIMIEIETEKKLTKRQMLEAREDCATRLSGCHTKGLEFLAEAKMALSFPDFQKKKEKAKG